MKRFSVLVLVALSASTLAACDGLKEALTAHVDVVARAGSQELSVTRLSDMLGNAKMPVPVNREVAMVIARDLWVPYQLLAVAAARGDTLTDVKAMDAAASGMIEQAKLSRFMESIASKLPSDSGGQAAYESGKGDLFGARHILFLVPKTASAAVRDSVKRKAAQVRTQVTAANFAEMAKKFSQDNSAAKGGDLGLFPKGMMVKPFADAVAALKPGEISPLVETEFGYHIVQRSTWDQVRAQYAQQSGDHSRQAAESAYVAQAQAQAKVELKANAAATVKAIAKDPLDHRNDKEVVATSPSGDLTAGHLAMILLSMPQSGRVAQQIQSAPDSLVRDYAKSMAQRGVLIKRADSAKVGLTTEELNGLHHDFSQAVVSSWQALGVDPKSLADSAKTPAERERLAAARVEAFLDKIMAGQAQPVPVPSPLQIVLMNKYDAKVNPAGIDRAVERAHKLRIAADSVKTANQPKSSVPLPGGIGAGGGVPAQQQPPAATGQPSKQPASKAPHKP